ncbi:hypothetical protein NQZ79_g1675 [Umbelopsis isabellina]|nr:hypothetical protein NQZ79_g1675 [Umbelopsis isabellina]
MSVSIADLFEDYLENTLTNVFYHSKLSSAQFAFRDGSKHARITDYGRGISNLLIHQFTPTELRETYTKHRRSYTKQTRPPANSPATTPVSPSPPPMNLVASRLQIEKEYKNAMQKQDHKIDLAMRMYDLISRHIERLDSQITKSGVAGADWIGAKKETLTDEKLFMDYGELLIIKVAKGKKRVISNLGWQAYLTRDPMDWFQVHHANDSYSYLYSDRTSHSSRPNPNQSGADGVPDLDIDPNEPTYCYCNQVSFGDMVACDSESCEREWFHYQCVGLVEPPAGKWYCDDCLEDMNLRKRMRRSPSSVSFN